MNPEIQSQILGFIVFAIPLIVALWKVFALLKGIEDRLDDQIHQVDRRLESLAHQSQLRASQMEHLNDKLTLSLNGTKELVNHLRTRTKIESDRLDDRLRQLEQFLVKTTNYQPRE